MNHHPRIARRRSTQSTPSDATGGSASLPGDLLEQSCKRVGVASLIFAVLWTVPLVMNNLVLRWVAGLSQMHLGTAWPWPGNLFAGTGVIVSLAMFVMAGALYGRPSLLLDLGLVFEVVTAFLVAVVLYWEPQHVGGLSWVVVVILVYPAIAPNTVGKTLAAALAAASMDPIGLLIAKLRGVTIPIDTFGLLWQIIPNYIAAVLAVIPVQIIRTLGRQVSKARELGSYRLNDLIGKGGMGEVYRATHRMLARPAAIKLIRPESLGGSLEAARVMRERFRREAEAAASLRSPHTIELYDFGVTEDGTFYYAMELLDGIDLDTLVARYGPLPYERVLHLLRQTLLSLGEAHRRGLIHRDIKPSNIHACRMGLAVDFVKVLDFGLVKGEGPRRQATLTSPDVATGTPAFMAPEVAMGNPDIDHRVDVYSLGCVAYWLLTGRLVFEGENAMKTMLSHVQDEPEPPSRRTELEIPPSLDAIVLACLAKEPGARPGDAAELAEQFATVDVRTAWTDDRALRWWDAHLPERPDAVAKTAVAHPSQAILTVAQ